MTEPLAFLNGRLVPLSEATVPIHDAGFMQGTTVAEQLRTFGGQLFRLDAHLARLQHSLDIVGVDPGMPLAPLGEIAVDLVERNRQLLDPADDLNLAMFVTPGPYPAMAPDAAATPTVCVHTRPIPFRFWAKKYIAGESVAISTVRQISEHCWPPQLKCRSRMHYHLADRDANARFPGARAILLHEDGTVCEATTANLIVYIEGEGLVSPPHERILPGISVATAADLARELGIAFHERDLYPDDLRRAGEMMLTSTSPCILPVARLDGNPVGSGAPGPVFARLLIAWGEHVGVDLAAQALRFANR